MPRLPNAPWEFTGTVRKHIFFMGRCSAPSAGLHIQDALLQTGRVRVTRLGVVGDEKKGDGCKNGSIKEDELLGAVAQVLGIETFEQGEFEERVGKILIEGERIRVEVREGE